MSASSMFGGSGSQTTSLRSRDIARHAQPHPLVAVGQWMVPRHGAREHGSLIDEIRWNSSPPKIARSMECGVCQIDASRHGQDRGVDLLARRELQELQQ